MKRKSWMKISDDLAKNVDNISSIKSPSFHKLGDTSFKNNVMKECIDLTLMKNLRNVC